MKPSVAATLAPSTGASLSLSAAPVAAASSRPQPFPAPTVDEVRDLSPEKPVLRVDRIRSALGTLVVTGASSVVWEAASGETGALTADGALEGVMVDTPGNRPLVTLDDGLVLVALRHVNELRRALVVGRDVSTLGVRLFDGETVTVSSSTDMPVLSILVVDGLVELRSEPVPAGMSNPDVHREFGFTMTPRFDFRAPRR